MRARQIRELDLEHLARARDDVVAARAGSDAAEHEDVPEIVERRKVRDAVAKVGADRLVDAPRARVARGHQRLHELQPLGQAHVGRRVDAGHGHQPADALLREILGAHAVVARPLVDCRAGLIVDRARTRARSATR